MEKTNKEGVADKIYRVLGFFFIIGFALLSLTSAISLVSNKQIAHAAKPDPCKIYQEKALAHLRAMENPPSSKGLTEERNASVSAAYSGYYLVCRDLERRESQ